nr:hypothetical protein [Mycoplasmopsis bovis]
MSRIGNSLDNREIEYFFSVLKTEMFENFEKSVKKMTLKNLSVSHKWKFNEHMMLGFFIIAFLHNMCYANHTPWYWNQGDRLKKSDNHLLNPK